MVRFMMTIDARYLGDTANEVAGTATAEIGTNLWDWMREKEQEQ